MIMINRYLKILLSLCALIVVLHFLEKSINSVAYACSCNLPSNAIEALHHSDVVFSATVRDIKRTKLKGESYNAVWVDVISSWKGVTTTELIVYTTWSSCQFEFDIGSSYLLYGYIDEGQIKIISCSRSGELSTRTDDLNLLGAGILPIHDVNLSYSFHKWKWMLAGVGTSLVIILLGSYLIVQYTYRRYK